MKLNSATLFVVSKDGVTKMTLTMLTNAVQGGLQLNETNVFTTNEEAMEELRRRQLVYAGTQTLQRLAIEDLEIVVPQLEKVNREIEDFESRRQAYEDAHRQAREDALQRKLEQTIEKALG